MSEHRNCKTTGTVTLIQRFGGGLNLYVNLNILFLDGAYVDEHEYG